MFNSTRPARAHSLRRALVLVAVAVGSALASGTVGATTVYECKLRLDILAGQTAQVELTGRNATKDEASLSGKVTEATGKFGLAKYTDAIRKLNDYQAKLGQVAFAPTSDVTLSDLMLSSTQTIDCIRYIGQ